MIASLYRAGGNFCTSIEARLLAYNIYYVALFIGKSHMLCVHEMIDKHVCMHATTGLYVYIKTTIILHFEVSWLQSCFDA